MGRGGAGRVVAKYVILQIPGYSGTIRLLVISSVNQRCQSAAPCAPFLSSPLQRFSRQNAGMAARTAHWMKQFFDISYSITAHSKDLWSHVDHAVGLTDLVADATFVAVPSDFASDWITCRFPGAGRVRRRPARRWPGSRRAGRAAPTRGCVRRDRR